MERNYPPNIYTLTHVTITHCWSSSCRFVELQTPYVNVVIILQFAVPQKQILAEMFFHENFNHTSQVQGYLALL